VLDTALSSALLEDVIAGAPPVVRMWRSEPLVSFGRLDWLEDGFTAAVAAARDHGFAPVMRVGGGRATAVDAGVLQLGIGERAAASTTERFVATADLLRSSLARLGVVTEVGELPGEFCPGAWSLHAGGIKLCGIAQRVSRGAAWTEAFVMVTDAGPRRAAMVPVYAALGVPLDPGTVGALDDLVPGLRWEDAAAAVRTELGELVPEGAGDALLARARELRERHEPLTRPPRRR
jgi:hypothetical protein